jgi:hypothetical protein
LTSRDRNLRLILTMWSIHGFSIEGTQKLLTGMPIRRPLFQGAGWRVGIEFSVVIVISDADPFHLRARSASTACDSPPRKGAMRRNGSSAIR